MNAPVCDACRARQDAWRDARIQDLFPGLGYVTQASASYDDTAAGVADRRRHRGDRFRRLVREQISGIAEDCQRWGHCEEGNEMGVNGTSDHPVADPGDVPASWRHSLLLTHLGVAVPMLIADLQDLAGRDPEGYRTTVAQWARDGADALSSSGDSLLYPTKPHAATRKHVAEPGTRGVFVATARGLAAGATVPGGVTFCGQHWCTDHQVCETAVQEATGRAQEGPA